jgi:hypothetical protein
MSQALIDNNNKSIIECQKVQKLSQSWSVNQQATWPGARQAVLYTAARSFQTATQTR